MAPSRRLLVSLVLLLLLASLSAPAPAAGDYPALVRSHFMGLSPRAGSRLLGAAQQVKKGDRCIHYAGKNVCDGVAAKDGTQLLRCCKNHCRNVLTDRNNCGRCGNKCGFGQLCCRGKCAAVAYDVANCGECGTECAPWERCEYGACGYA